MQENEEGSLLRAADLIGQLGDPHYLRKANALYYEFDEVGMNKQLRLYVARRSCRTIFAILLEQRFPTYPTCNPLSQRHLKRAAMDRKSL